MVAVHHPQKAYCSAHKKTTNTTHCYGQQSFLGLRAGYFFEEGVEGEARDKFGNHEESHPETVDGGVEAEEHKKLVIGKTNAIPHPWTMMIHFEDAAVADFAVVSALRPNQLARNAVRVDFVFLVETVRAVDFFKALAWIVL